MKRVGSEQTYSTEMLKRKPRQRKRRRDRTPASAIPRLSQALRISRCREPCLSKVKTIRVVTRWKSGPRLRPVSVPLPRNREIVPCVDGMEAAHGMRVDIGGGADRDFILIFRIVASTHARR